MRPLQFTREDFNLLMNFGDLRAAEFSLSRDGQTFEPFEYTTNFISNQDMVVDYVSAAKVQRLLAGASRFQARVARHYPWHEAFIDDCVVLSRRHLHAYTPVLVVARNEPIRPPRSETDLPIYFRRFGDRTEVAPVTHAFEPSGSEVDLTVFYRPDVRIQQELLVRLFRQKAGEGVDDADAGSSPVGMTPADEAAFNQALLQLWPVGGFGRLSSYLHLKEGHTPLLAELVTWNVRPTEEGLHTLGGERIDPSGPVGGRLTEGGVRRHYGFSRSQETDRLALVGALHYRRDNGWRTRGWCVAASGIDPLVSVRSDGIYRWMTMPHGGIESIEALDNGANHGLGSSFIAEKFGALLGRGILFGGLGLGVLQRQLSRGRKLTTVESNLAVIDIYRQLGLEHRDHKIVEADFEVFLASAERSWDAIVLDYADPDLRAITPGGLAQLGRCLASKGCIAVNHQGAPEVFVARVRETAGGAGFRVDIHDLGHEQVVAILARV